MAKYKQLNTNDTLKSIISNINDNRKRKISNNCISLYNKNKLLIQKIKKVKREVVKVEVDNEERLKFLIF